VFTICEVCLQNVNKFTFCKLPLTLKGDKQESPPKEGFLHQLTLILAGKMLVNINTKLPSP
jgi:uncharacterized Zn-binding protein involved in type VI secretion